MTVMSLGAILLFLIPLGVILVLLAFTIALCIRPWLMALLSGAPVSLPLIIAMRMRRVNPTVIIRARIMSVKAGLYINISELEAHYLAGGNVMQIVAALIAAEQGELEITFMEAAAIDLAGRDVSEAVDMALHPKTLECPDPASASSWLTTVAMDGVEIKVRAKVTVRANLHRLIGGAGEETIISRVSECIGTTIGAIESHMTALQDRDAISRAVREQRVDAGTAYDILSIDIFDMKVGENTGALFPVLGMGGIATTALDPDGSATIGGKNLAVASHNGFFIAEGSSIVVMKVEGESLIVELSKEASAI
jgi:uncharacterized protein YqfA (UPF0365 family)